MPDQIPAAESAIRRMKEALERLFIEAMGVFMSDDYEHGRGDARERYRRLRQKHDNLKEVIRVLRECRIVWAPFAQPKLGEADRTTTPPTVLVAQHLQGARDAVIAQVLAHEAIHLMTLSRNSVDQEIRCRRKELEVWELLKGDEEGPFDFWCKAVQEGFAHGEEAYRTDIRGMYPLIQEHDDPPPPPPPAPPSAQPPPPAPPSATPPPPPPRSRIRIAPADFKAPNPWVVLGRSLRYSLESILAGSITARTYGFSIEWPRGYLATESGDGCGCHGLIGVAELAEGAGRPPVFAVFEAPNVIHGGEWASFDAQAQHRVDVWNRFGVRSPGGAGELMDDRAVQLDGQPARLVEAVYTMLAARPTDEPRRRVRERAIYAQLGHTLYSIAMICETAEWATRVSEFERAVASFRMRT
jgi:hypothetical protein